MSTSAVVWSALYKKASDGKIQYWSIRVEDSTIIVTYGDLGGKMQEASDTISTGKNLGKKNETSAEQQAELEAEAKWYKQIERKGYVADLTRAEAGETDAEGGIAPMLAQPHEKCMDKLVFPCLTQRKYNGVRVIAVWEDGVCTLWSRKRERMIGLPHIERAIEKLMAGSKGRIVFDGEGYVHGWTLQQIASYARQKKTPKPGFEQVEYHIYDLPEHGGDNNERQRDLDLILLNAPHPLKGVETVVSCSEEGIWTRHDDWVGDGYEGAIGRNLKGPYEAGKRSNNLHKFKRFSEHEFKVTGGVTGRGKYADILILKCRVSKELELETGGLAKAGAVFDCNPPGTLEDRRSVRIEEVVGKMLTVKHIGWTEEGKPFHPVGVVIRDYE